jgi:AcrR family transcriptional regulator
MGMRGPNKTNDKSAEGLRERKRRQTRERISQAAMALFIARGFDATTIDDIAAAADVSKRSFFDYFPTKEDVIFAWQDAFGESLAAAVAERPADEPLISVIEEALVSVITRAVADPQTMALTDLIGETPALRARDQLKYAKLEQVLVDALAKRTKGKDGKLRAQVLAMMVIGAMRIGKETWQDRQKTETIDDHARRIFKAIRAELREFDSTSGKRS